MVPILSSRSQNWWETRVVHENRKINFLFFFTLIDALYSNLEKRVKKSKFQISNFRLERVKMFSINNVVFAYKKRTVSFDGYNDFRMMTLGPERQIFDPTVYYLQARSGGKKFREIKRLLLIPSVN